MRQLRNLLRKAFVFNQKIQNYLEGRVWPLEGKWSKNVMEVVPTERKRQIPEIWLNGDLNSEATM